MLNFSLGQTLKFELSGNTWISSQYKATVSIHCILCWVDSNYIHSGFGEDDIGALMDITQKAIDFGE